MGVGASRTRRERRSSISCAAGIWWSPTMRRPCPPVCTGCTCRAAPTSRYGSPAAFDPPSAGFALDWRALRALGARGIAFATITHAAGISSTGDTELDRRLPLDEPYRIPVATAFAIRRTRAQGGRIVAVGTTV